MEGGEGVQGARQLWSIYLYLEWLDLKHHCRCLTWLYCSRYYCSIFVSIPSMTVI